MTYKEVNPEIWTYDKEGDFIEGVLIKAESDVGVNKSNIYTIEVEEGKFVGVWGSTILDTRMSLVNEGQKVKITFKGLSEKKSGGKNPAKIFKVEVDIEED